MERSELNKKQRENIFDAELVELDNLAFRLRNKTVAAGVYENINMSAEKTETSPHAKLIIIRVVFKFEQIVCVSLPEC